MVYTIIVFLFGGAIIYLKIYNSKKNFKNEKTYLIITLFISLFFTTNSVMSEEKKVIESGHNYNIYTGMFDFSDDGKNHKF